MRQLIVQVPRGSGKKVLDLAKQHQGANLSQVEATASNGEIDLVTIYLPNRQVEAFLEKIQDLSDVHTSMLPDGVMVLKSPASEAPQ